MTVMKRDPCLACRCASLHYPTFFQTSRRHSAPLPLHRHTVSNRLTACNTATRQSSSTAVVTASTLDFNLFHRIVQSRHILDCDFKETILASRLTRFDV